MHTGLRAAGLCTLVLSPQKQAQENFLFSSVTCINIIPIRRSLPRDMWSGARIQVSSGPGGWEDKSPALRMPQVSSEDELPCEFKRGHRTKRAHSVNVTRTWGCSERRGRGVGAEGLQFQCSPQDVPRALSKEQVTVQCTWSRVG